MYPSTDDVVHPHNKILPQFVHCCVHSGDKRRCNTHESDMGLDGWPTVFQFALMCTLWQIRMVSGGGGPVGLKYSYGQIK